MNEQLAPRLLHQMQRIRAVEEEIARRYTEWQMRCPTHLSIGQEAVPAAIGETLTAADLAVSTHRGHAHYLAKGGNLPAMIAEIYGKAAGCAGGKGGSMHLIDRSVGFMGTSAIVGNSIPIGVGLALGLQLKDEGHLACVFLGDGAIEEGVFYESANFAAVRKLPVLFVCENNLYSVYAPLHERQPAGRSISAMVGALGIPSACGDGNDAVACHRLLGEAVAHIRAGRGPYFLEFATYRWREHCGHAYDNDLGYRTIEEFQLWQTRDPIARLRREILAERPAAADDLHTMETAIQQEVAAAFDFARQAPFADPAEAYTGVYA
ncbi:MAG TPA: thiamine pyrophosphate-dependent dehydrogenase E1 component subunit alpha [Azonexus sp.]|nr:thiamine pyrophosphate-dependent dehydrogenase E1 component subunit alpha [Azonexus sp.]